MCKSSSFIPYVKRLAVKCLRWIWRWWFAFIFLYLIFSQIRECVSSSLEPPEQRSLHFILNDNEVTIKVGVEGLRKLRGMDAARADEVLHFINLLPRVSNPALVACLLKQAAVSQYLFVEQYNKLTAKGRRNLAQPEQDKIWTEGHKNKEIQNVVIRVYINTCDSLIRSKELRRLRWTSIGSAHSRKRWLYENPLEDSTEESSHGKMVEARIDDIRKTWSERIKKESVFNRYGLEQVRKTLS